MTKKFYPVNVAADIGGAVHGLSLNMTSTDVDPGTGSPVTQTVNVNGSAENQLCYAFYTPAGEPNSASWPQDSSADTYRLTLEVITAGADLTYGTLADKGGHAARVNSGLTADLETADMTWGGTRASGTGIKQFATWNTVAGSGWNPAAGSASDRFEALVGADNANMMAQAIQVRINTSETFLQGPWSVGPVTINRTALDTTIFSENISRFVDSFRSTNDSLSVSESISSYVSKIRTLVDTVSVTDSVSRIANKVRTLSDTTSVTDAVARVANKIRTITDSVAGVTDSVVRAGILKVRTALDTTTLSEGVSRAAISFSRTVGDTLSGVTDSVTRSVQFVRTTVENIAIGADTISSQVFRVLIRTASDTITSANDSVQRMVVVGRTVLDTTSVSDTATRMVTVLRSAADTITSVTDSIASQVIVGAQQFFRTASDTISTSDTIARVITAVRSVADTTVVTDSVSRSAISFVRVAQDTVASATDAIARVANKIRTTTDTTSLSEVVSRAWTGTRSAVDTLPAIVDSIFTSASIIIYRTVNDTVNVVEDAISRTANMGRSAVDTLVTTDLAQRMATYVRSVSDSYDNLSDFVVRGGIVVRRSVADFITPVTDVVSAFIGIPKFIGEIISVGKSRNLWRVAKDNIDHIRGRDNAHKVRNE